MDSCQVRGLCVYAERKEKDSSGVYSESQAHVGTAGVLTFAVSPYLQQEKRASEMNAMEAKNKEFADVMEVRRKEVCRSISCSRATLTIHGYAVYYFPCG